MNTAKNLLRDVHPDLLVLIDFPDFNLHLAATAKRIGVPVLYYITPQVWAWRKGRVRTMKRRIDHAAVILPFEADFFRRHGIAATYVGHPLLDDEPAKTAAAEKFWSEAGGKGPLVALLPGSRQREVAGHLPVMIEAAGRLARRHPELRFAVSVAPSVPRRTVEEILTGRSSLPASALTVTEAPVEALFSACKMAVAVSGTVTLQAALAGTPTVVVYRVSALSYWAGRALIRVPFIGLANLIAGRQVMPELIQKEASADRIARTVEEIVFSPETLEQMRRGLSRIRLRMGQPGASGRVADIAMEMLGEPPRREAGKRERLDA
jgi:lipid-A-disaccharide synthase